MRNPSQRCMCLGLTHHTASTSSHDWIGIFALPNEKLCTLAAPVKLLDEGGVDTTANPAYARGGLLLEVNFLCSLIGGNLRLVRPIEHRCSVLLSDPAPRSWSFCSATRARLERRRTQRTHGCH